MINGQLLQLLAVRAEAERPLRVGLIGAGKFGTMFLSQARRVPGLHVLGVAALPIGLAHGVRLEQPVAAGQVVRWTDVIFDETDPAVRLRRELEQQFA